MDVKLIVHPRDILPKIAAWSEIQKQYDYYTAFAAAIKPKFFLEIGVAAGYSSYAILEGCEKAGCKPFVVWIDYCDGHGLDNNHNYALGLIRGRFGIDPDDRIVNSRDVHSFDMKFDLVHVDGDHSYDGCKHDIEISSLFLTEDGCIICHDTNDENVSRAIDDFLKDNFCFAVLNAPQVRCGVRIIYRKSSFIVNDLWQVLVGRVNMRAELPRGDK